MCQGLQGFWVRSGFSRRWAGSAVRCHIRVVLVLGAGQEEPLQELLNHSCCGAGNVLWLKGGVCCAARSIAQSCTPSVAVVQVQVQAVVQVVAAAASP